MTVMTAHIIDGKAIAQKMRIGLRDRANALRVSGIIPRLDVILIGELAPSVIYVRNKQRAAESIGVSCTIHRFDETVTQETVLSLIDTLNREHTHGILLQLPIPAHLDTVALLNAIAPERDVDGLNLINVGRRTVQLPGLLPCTPKGCITLLKTVQSTMAGLHAVVIGRSDLVGKPMAQLLLRENCTVTQAHAHTQNLPDLCRQADILVVAIGKPHFIQGDWIKKGALVIDVGINRVNDTLVGDVDFDTAQHHARAITPVPGGVGPITIATLLENTIESAENSLKKS